MEKENSLLVDEGLAAIRHSFDGAQYINDTARECAERMMLGEHRDLELPDSAIMEIYGIITSGEKVRLKRTNDNGDGFLVHIESYEDLLSLIKQEADAQLITGEAEREDE